MDRKQIASIQESIGETSSQSVVVAVDRYGLTQHECFPLNVIAMFIADNKDCPLFFPQDFYRLYQARRERNR